MEWIRVKERLPNDDQTVLAYNEKLKGEMLPIKCYFAFDVEEFLSLETINQHPISITHWMPFPQTPKE